MRQFIYLPSHDLASRHCNILLRCWRAIIILKLAHGVKLSLLLLDQTLHGGLLFVGLVVRLLLEVLTPAAFTWKRSVIMRLRLVANWSDSCYLAANVTVGLYVHHLLVCWEGLVHLFVAHAIDFCLARWPLRTISTPSQIWDVQDWII